jgi:hypothetical protein
MIQLADTQEILQLPIIKPFFQNKPMTQMLLWG